jgi:hypothetical protein
MLNMRLIRRLSIIAILTQLLFQGALVSSGTPQTEIVFSTPELIKAEFDSVPCRDKDRLNAVKALFEKMGATPSEISIEKYRDVENLVVHKQGASPEIIVIGAHYDKVPEGCGAVDNWTGIVILAHLYKSLRNAPLQKTLLFVAFGKEEGGLFGSRAMVGTIKKDQVAQYCEMINFDSLGLAGLQAADNLSSKKLVSLAGDVAEDLRFAFHHAIIKGADADSNSFIGKRIPSVTIHGLSREWADILHSRKDQPSRVNSVNVYLGYRLGLAMVSRLDKSACGEYR